MALNQRYLNPKLGRVIKTLGFDRDWAHGRGSLLIDRGGNEYLDLLSGYGVFALGRSHPYVKEQLARVLAADPPALPQHSGDRKSTRLNSSHVKISYAVFCLKKK